MLTKKKKGQISMEMLIVVGVLVIGGVIFGSIYLSNIQSQSKKGGDVSSIVDDLMGGFGGWNDDKWVPSIPDHCRNEVQDADEEDVDCGGNDCFECFTPGELAINLVLFPEGSTIVDDSFNINVLLTNGTDHSNSEVIIKEIKVENEITRTPTTNCSFNGSYTSTFSPSNLSFGSNDALSLAFSCNAPGEYRFTVYAGVAGNSDASLNSIESKIKEITHSLEIIPPSLFNAEILSPQNGYYDISYNLLLSSEIIGPEENYSCRWISINKKDSEKKVISNSCTDLIVTNIYFEEDNTYDIYLNIYDSELNHVSAGPNNITIINTDSLNQLFFNPPEKSQINSNFTTSFISETKINDTVNIISLTAQDCTFTRIKPIDPDIITITDPTTQNKKLLYSYDYNSICSSVGTKTINLKVDGENINITEYYEITPVMTPFLNMILFLDDTEAETSVESQIDEIIFKNKDDTDIIYFAANQQATNYELNQNQKFYIRPLLGYIDASGLISLIPSTTCNIKIKKQGNSSILSNFEILSNDDLLLKINGVGIHEIIISANVPNHGMVNLTKTINLIEVPFSIKNISPNREYRYNGNVNFDINLNNIGGNSVTIDMNLHKKQTSGMFNKKNLKKDDTLYFASSGHLPAGSYESFNCNAVNTNCNKNIIINEIGEYTGKVTVTSGANQQIEYITFSVINSPSSVQIFSAGQPYIGTKNTYYALLESINNGKSLYFVPKNCSWSSTFTNTEDVASNNYYEITPADPKDVIKAIYVTAYDLMDSPFNSSNFVKGIEDSMIVYSNSVTDINTSDPNFGVHLKGSSVHLSILQKDAQNDYEKLNSEFTCSWKYRKEDNPYSWTSLTTSDCNLVIPDSNTLDINSYVVTVEVKYNGTTLYTLSSNFKIRECVIGAERCKYNGVCEENGRCTYIKFPNNSLDYSYQYVNLEGVSYQDNHSYWYFPPITGIGYNCLLNDFSPSYQNPFEDPTQSIFDCFYTYRSSYYSQPARVSTYHDFFGDIFPKSGGNTAICSVAVDGPFNSICNNGICYSADFIHGMKSVKDYYANDYEKFTNWLHSLGFMSYDFYPYTDSYLSSEVNPQISDSLYDEATLSLNFEGVPNNIEVIAKGVAVENKKTNYSGTIPSVINNLGSTDLFYYSLDDNKSIRRFGLINYKIDLNYFANSNLFIITDKNVISFSDIEPYLSSDNSLISYNEDDIDYNFYYDYPQIARKDNKVAVVGQRYALDDIDKNMVYYDFYILYNPNINTNNWELHTYVSLNLIPLEARGNSLLFDSENNLHYAFISTDIELIEDNVQFPFLNNRAQVGSQPSELIFNTTTREMSYKKVFPNPGINNVSFDYFAGKNTNSSYVSLAYESTAITHFDEEIEEFRSYSQQSINEDKNWVIQMWTSYPIYKNAYDNKWNNGDSSKRVIKIALSNDNGKHWTAPINLISTISTLPSVHNFSPSGVVNSWLFYPTISKNIKKVNDNNGQFTIMAFLYSTLVDPRVVDTVTPYVFTFNIDFGNLLISEDENEYNNYLFTDSSTGNIMSGLVSDINFMNYTRPYYINKISDDINFSDSEYLNNCVWFNYQQDVPTLTNKNCIFQTEQPYLVNMFKYRLNNTKNLDVHGCGPIATSTGSGYPTYNFCFKKGTKIYTPNGWINIEKINVGDEVYSLEEETNALVISKVKSPLIHNNEIKQNLYEVILSNGVILYVTENHSFFVKNINDYKQLREISFNDKLYYYSLDKKMFETVNIISKEKSIIDDTYYNLSLTEHHNYLAEGVVVHNDRKRLPPPIVASGYPMPERLSGWQRLLKDYAWSKLNETMTNYNRNYNALGGHYAFTHQVLGNVTNYGQIGNTMYFGVAWGDGSYGFGYVQGYPNSSGGYTVVHYGGYNVGNTFSGFALPANCPGC